jgi:hypothetical protein
MAASWLAASMEARSQRRAGLRHPWQRELTVSVVGVKATTVAIACEFHPLDLGVSVAYSTIPYGTAEEISGPYAKFAVAFGL